MISHILRLIRDMIYTTRIHGGQRSKLTVHVVECGGGTPLSALNGDRQLEVEICTLGINH